MVKFRKTKASKWTEEELSNSKIEDYKELKTAVKELGETLESASTRQVQKINTLSKLPVKAEDEALRAAGSLQRSLSGIRKKYEAVIDNYIEQGNKKSAAEFADKYLKECKGAVQQHKQELTHSSAIKTETSSIFSKLSKIFSRAKKTEDTQLTSDISNKFEKVKTFQTFKERIEATRPRSDATSEDSPLTPKK